MRINDDIREYLIVRQIESINNTENKNSYFLSLIQGLKSIDLSNISSIFYGELISSCNNEWNEIMEKIDSILFEYDYIYHTNEEAVAYGLIFDQPTGLKLSSLPYSIGDNYHFAALFEGVSGVVLSVLNPLSEIDLVESRETDGFYDLRDAYLYTAYIALHDAIRKFVKTDSFEKLPRQSPFHFLIQEHDCLAQPLYIIE